MDLQTGKQGENIQVFARIKPSTNELEGLANSLVRSEGSILLVDYRSQSVKVKFDRVFRPAASQEDVFETVKPLVVDLLSGRSCGLVAYGQTGSGKTYTVFGKSAMKRNYQAKTAIDESSGILPRMVSYLYSRKPLGSTLTLSMCQIYNDLVYDLIQVAVSSLLQKDDQPLNVQEDSSGQACIQGLAGIEVQSVEEALFLLARGEQNRIVRETEMNAHSSRSHTIVLVDYLGPSHTITDADPQRESSQELRRPQSPAKSEFTRLASRLILCDLAGSERMSDKINVKDKRFAELKAINLSLTALGKVIYTMSAHHKFLPPFRDSNLTRILKPAFVGGSKMHILVTLDSKSSSLEETMNTIRFARFARRVKIKVTKKPRGSKSPQISNLRSTISLKEEIIQFKGKLNNRHHASTTKLEALRVNIGLKREHERVHWVCGGRPVEDIVQENSRLHAQIQKLSAVNNLNQLESQQGKRFDDIDSTGSGLDATHQTKSPLHRIHFMFNEQHLSEHSHAPQETFSPISLKMITRSIGTVPNSTNKRALMLNRTKREAGETSGASEIDFSKKSLEEDAEHKEKEASCDLTEAGLSPILPRYSAVLPPIKNRYIAPHRVSFRQSVAGLEKKAVQQTSHAYFKYGEEGETSSRSLHIDSHGLTGSKLHYTPSVFPKLAPEPKEVYDFKDAPNTKIGLAKYLQSHPEASIRNVKNHERSAFNERSRAKVADVNNLRRPSSGKSNRQLYSKSVTNHHFVSPERSACPSRALESTLGQRQTGNHLPLDKTREYDKRIRRMRIELEAMKLQCQQPQ